MIQKQQVYPNDLMRQLQIQTIGLGVFKSLGNCLDADGSLIEHQDFLIKPDGFEIPFQSEQIHGISTALASANGKTLDEVLVAFQEVLSKTKNFSRSKFKI